MGHLNGILARVGGNWNNNFQKSQMPGGVPGGDMLKLRFDRYIRGPEGVVVVPYFLTQLSTGSISVGLHSQQSICQATLLIDIIHLPNLFHTSRVNQLLNPDRERYFFMKDAGHILRMNPGGGGTAIYGLYRYVPL